jgi:hypothetical protein
MMLNGDSRVREGGHRAARTVVTITPMLFKPDRIRGIDRVIDYFGGAGPGVASVMGRGAYRSGTRHSDDSRTHARGNETGREFAPRRSPADGVPGDELDFQAGRGWPRR